MSHFIDWLEEASARDTRVRAILRRSLAFEPGTFVAAYPYIEPFAGASPGAWHRTAQYLVGGLWAMHWREGRGQVRIPLGRAAVMHQVQTGSTSTERRFISLLDADEDQLPHRLRQMVALLKEQPIDFHSLLNGVARWNDDRKLTQIRWAKDFYQGGDGREEAPPTSTDGAST
jgi:CRISPR system Cascade subunit CasB